MRALVPVLHVLGGAIVSFALMMLLPLGIAWYGNDAALHAYSTSFLITLLSGAGIYLATRRDLTRSNRELQPRDGFLLVSLVWTVLPVFAMLPLMLYLPELSFTNAYFEAVSGLTTTGATVLTHLDALPASINVWRCMLIWIGGMGILVLGVAILPMLGVGGSQIYKPETPGPMKDAKLTPRITETAKSLYAVYFVISLACLLSLRAAGMTWVDAACHMFSTLGLGAFSSHDASYAYFHSVRIEVVTEIFMVLAGINFATHFLVWRKKSLGAYFRSPETRWFVIVLVAGVLLVAYYLVETGTYDTWGEALRYAAFNTVSLATTTGFVNTDYAKWPIFAPVLMLFLCSFTTCAGSAGGGIKMVRALLLFKQAKRELTVILHPRAVSPVRYAGEMVENKVIFSVLAFMLMYGVVVIFCTLLLLFSGLDVITAFTAVIATINNAGPGLGQVGPASTYAGLTDFQTWVCAAIMLLGRLELFTILVIFTRGFWRK
jgi:trk system potassium uptake protein TrkH